MKQLAALALTVAAFSACTHVGSESAGTPSVANARPHVLRMTGIGDVPTLNAALGADLYLAWLSEMTQAFLFRDGSDNRPIPELATVVPTMRNGGVSADGKTITFHLRKGVKWSDGAPFGAADVVFSTNIIRDPKTNTASKDGWDRILSVAAPDAYTVVYHLKEPYPPFTSTFFSTAGANPAIMPQHLLAHTADINKDPYNALPVGIGPFKYVAWKRGDRIVMDANPLYWRGTPKLHRIEYVIIPNRDSAVASMQTGGIDLWPFVPGAYYVRLASLPNVEVFKQPGFTYDHIDFNLSHPVLRDRAVRAALRLATDRVALSKLVGHGLAILQEGFVSARSPYFDPRVRFVAYDPAKANAMLDAAGWRRGPDGVRAKGDTRLSLLLVANTGSSATATSLELLRSWWQKIGVDVQTKLYEPSLFISNILPGGKFDAVVYAQPVDPQGDFSNAFSCKLTPPNGQNYTHFCNATVDAAIADFRQTYDAARGHRDDDLVQETVAAEVPTIVEDIRYNAFALRRGLSGFRPNQATPFDDMMHVDI
jgi:peptide/nickel transport system substrate-binding protein